MRRNFLLISLFSILLFSCNEDKDDVFPSISISSPSEGSRFKVDDVISISASISDDQNIENVRIGIQEQSTGRGVLKAISLSPGGTSYSLSEIMVISDSLLNTGVYSIRIDAYDGENTTSAFVSVNIEGINRKSLGLVLALDNGVRAEMIKIDKDQNQSLLFTQAGLGQIDINSNAQQLWFTDTKQAKIGVYNLRESTLDFEAYPNSNNQSDRILDADLVGDKFYVATDRSTVQAFNSSFQDIFTYQSPLGFLVRDIYPMNNRIMVREVDLQGNNQSFKYLFSNGAVDTRGAEQSLVVGFGERLSAQEQSYMFINQAGNLLIRDYNLQSGLSSFLSQRSNVNPVSILQINEFEYLIASQSAVFQFNLSTNFLRTIASNKVNPKMTYDEVDNVVYVASGRNLSAYGYQQANLLYTSSLQHPIIDLAVQYNKN